LKEADLTEDNLERLDKLKHLHGLLKNWSNENPESKQLRKIRNKFVKVHERTLTRNLELRGVDSDYQNIINKLEEKVNSLRTEGTTLEKVYAVLHEINAEIKKMEKLQQAQCIINLLILKLRAKHYKRAVQRRNFMFDQELICYSHALLWKHQTYRRIEDRIFNLVGWKDLIVRHGCIQLICKLKWGALCSGVEKREVGYIFHENKLREYWKKVMAEALGLTLNDISIFVTVGTEAEQIIRELASEDKKKQEELGRFLVNEVRAKQIMCFIPF